MKKRVKPEELKKIVESIIKKKRHIRSLREFRELVLKELKTSMPDAGVSEGRIKRIVKEVKNIKLNVHVKRSKGSEVEKCPVCGRSLKKTYIHSLTGENIFVSLKCEHCNFESKSKSFKPSRYEFYFSEK